MIIAQKCLCNDQSHKQVWTSLNMFGVQSDLTRSKFWIDLEKHFCCCCNLTKFSILKISRFESCFFPYSFFHSFITSKQGIWQCHRLVGQSWWKKNSSKYHTVWWRIPNYRALCRRPLISWHKALPSVCALSCAGHTSATRQAKQKVARCFYLLATRHKSSKADWVDD